MAKPIKKKPVKTTVNQRTVWIISAIAVAVLIVAVVFLYFYITANEALFGEAVTIPNPLADDSQYCTYLCKKVCGSEKTCLDKCVKVCLLDLSPKRLSTK